MGHTLNNHKSLLTRVRCIKGQTVSLETVAVPDQTEYVTTGYHPTNRKIATGKTLKKAVASFC